MFRFTLNNLYSYTRVYTGLNNQKKYETYEFLNLRNKLRASLPRK